MTKIEWTHRPETVGVTWNVMSGCTPISEGCTHCYAKRMATRLAGRFGYPADEPFKVTLHEDRLDEPLTWKKPRTVFVCSMGDLFHDLVPETFQRAVWGIMKACPQHTFMVLTKRPELMKFRLERYVYPLIGVLPNVWGLVTAENQEQADKRIPELLAIPFAVHGVSIEPMLGPVNIAPHLSQWRYEDAEFPHPNNRLDWVIVGGETGPGARPMHPEWARSVRDQCQQAGVPFFFKRWGNWIPQSQSWPARREILKHSPSWGEWEYWHAPTQELDGESFYRVGPKAAGDLLDGQQYHEWPEVA